MRTIDIGIRHDDDTVITSFCEIKCITDTTANSRDEVFDLFVQEYLINTSLFSIEDFTSKWEDSLDITISTLFRRTTR
jgi:hypothetical protein